MVNSGFGPGGETSAPGSKPKVKSQLDPGETNVPKQLHISKPKKLARKPAATLCKITQITQTSVAGFGFFFEGEESVTAQETFFLSLIFQSISESANQRTFVRRSHRRFRGTKAADASRAAEKPKSKEKKKYAPVESHPQQTAPPGGRSQASSPSCLGVEVESNRQPSPCSDNAGVECHSPRRKLDTRRNSFTLFALRNVASLSRNAAARLSPPLRQTLRVKLFCWIFFCFVLCCSFPLWPCVTETHDAPL